MSKRDNKLYLKDILDSIMAIEEYVENITFSQFCQDRKTYSASIREFEIIGEAVGKIIDEEIVKKYNDIYWRDIKDFRNLLIHEYFGVDFEIVWNSICDDLPKLKKVIIKILDEIA